MWFCMFYLSQTIQVWPNFDRFFIIKYVNWVLIEVYMILLSVPGVIPYV